MGRKKQAIEFNHTDLATQPHGHYSQATGHGGLIFVSGLLGNSEDEHTGGGGDITAQADHCLAQLAAILQVSRASLHNVLKLTVYVFDVALWPQVNSRCAHAFGGHRPARAIVTTGVLRYNSLIEIDAIAISE